MTGGILDDDIYAELEAQRDALINLHKKQLEANEDKKRANDSKNSGYLY